MIVAFDYDGVLDNYKIASLAKNMISEGNEVWVVTMRRENEHNKKVMAESLKSINLTTYNVMFCNDNPKFEIIRMLNADIYIDNISDEFEDILNYTKTVPLLWLNQ
jgi:mitochondrial fission protein ELM1